MPPRVTRSRKATTPRQSAPRSSRRSSAISDADDGIASGNTAVTAKSGVRTQPSYAYGSPEKAKAPKRLAAGLRDGAVADMIQGALATPRDVDEGDRYSESVPDEEEDGNKQRAGPVLKKEDSDDDDVVEEGLGEDGDAEDENDIEIEDPAEEEPDEEPLMLAADVSMVPNPNVSYIAENWISDPAGIVRESNRQTLLTILLTILILALGLFLGQSINFRESLSALPSLPSLHTLRNSILTPSASMMDGNSTHSYNMIVKQLSSIDARLSHLEKRKQAELTQTQTHQPKATKFSLAHSDIGQYVNFFAPNYGVQIDPFLTSPTREHPANTLFKPWQYKFIGAPRVKVPGPSTALLPWNDAGDCWCAANSTGQAQLVAVLGRLVSPRVLVVEHIPQSETLDPGATPRGVQLLVQIEDVEQRERARSAAMHDLGPATVAKPRSEDALRDKPGESQALDESWVVVAQGEFDAYGEREQSFEVSRALRDVGVEVRKVAFRTLGNWGPDAGEQGRHADHVCLYRLKLLGSSSEMTSTVPLR